MGSSFTQLTFEDARARIGRGGKRPGAGRPKDPHSGVSHLRRPKVSKHEPQLVTMRLRDDIPSLRTQRCYPAVLDALIKGRDRFGFRLVDRSVQDNHIHLIVEAEDQRALSRGMKGLTIRIAKAVNRVLGRAGSVFADRYHARALETPTEVRNAIAYVLNNWRKHARERGVTYPKRLADWFSSALGFDGWKEEPEVRPPPWVPAGPTCPPTSYLLRVGWRRRGLIDPGHVPGSERRRKTRRRRG